MFPAKRTQIERIWKEITKVNLEFTKFFKKIQKNIVGVPVVHVMLCESTRVDDSRQAK